MLFLGGAPVSYSGVGRERWASGCGRCWPVLPGGGEFASGSVICAVLSVSSCDWPLRSTVTVTRSEVPIVLKISMPALRIVQRRAVDRQHQVAGLQAELRELLPIAAGVDAIAALHAVRKHRLRAHDFRERCRIGLGDAPQVVGELTAARRGAAARTRDRDARGARFRQRQRFELAVAIQNDAIQVDRMQLVPGRTAAPTVYTFADCGDSPMTARPLVGSFDAKTADSTRFICVGCASVRGSLFGLRHRRTGAQLTIAWTSMPLRAAAAGGGA